MISGSMITIGNFTINAYVDNDHHLTVWITSTDGSLVQDISGDIGERGEFAVRLTTTKIEEAYQEQESQ
jgi:hypothetical protein